MTRRRAASMVAAMLVGCAPSGVAPEQAAIVRFALSTPDQDDWEPSLALGPDGSVAVIAARWLPDSSSRRRGRGAMATWDLPARAEGPTAARVLDEAGGDQRILIDGRGRWIGSWIRIVWDSSGRPDPDESGLVLATSLDQGRTWSSTLVATVSSGVGDKPELAISPDGRDLYLAFMGRGSLDLLASHDGGASWERHVADSTFSPHWPSGIALAPDGTLLVTNVRPIGARADTILSLSVDLLRSADGGRSWSRRRLTTANRWPDPMRCLRGPPCTVQTASASVAVDERGRAVVAYLSGRVDQPYRLHVMRSDDAGESWSAPLEVGAAIHRPTGGVAESFYPMIASAAGGVFHLVWFDDRDGPIGVFASRSVDGGRTWSDAVRLSSPAGLTGVYGEYGGLAIDARGRLHVTWSEGIGHVGAPGAHGGAWYARWTPGSRPTR